MKLISLAGIVAITYGVYQLSEAWAYIIAGGFGLAYAEVSQLAAARRSWEVVGDDSR